MKMLYQKTPNTTKILEVTVLFWFQIHLVKQGMKNLKIISLYLINSNAVTCLILEKFVSFYPAHVTFNIFTGKLAATYIG